MHLREGMTINRYRIKGLLGQGGMGNVYLAYDMELRRNVALKTLKTDAHSPGDAVRLAARLVREARSAAALNHPNIVSVYDAGEVDNTVYIALEFVEGRCLRDYVGESQIRWQVKLRWLIDVANALAAAHAHGFVHRDVKPENVMIREDGVVKILDFGIAKRIDSVDLYESGAHPSSTTSSNDRAAGSSRPSVPVRAEGDISQIFHRRKSLASLLETREGTFAGTLYYLAPEQFHGRNVDGRADQFAWGIMAYELLSGRRPWSSSHLSREEGGANARASEYIPFAEREKPPSMMGRVSEISQRIDSAILQTLEILPENRFESMIELVERLSSVAVPSLDDVVKEMRTSLSRRVVDGSAVTLSATEFERIKPISEAMVPRKRFRLRRVPFVIAFVAAVSVLAGGVAVKDSSSSPQGVDNESREIPRSTTLLDLPPPPTSHASARKVYAVAMDALRNADSNTAQQEFLRALSIDPGLAAAHLRLAILDSREVIATTEARRHFHQAIQQRASMTARDQGIVHAFAPYFQKDPPDLSECITRLERLSQDFPGDAEIVLYLGFVRVMYGQPDSALRDFAEAKRLDPGFALAVYQSAISKFYLGDIEGVRQDVASCLALAPLAGRCRWLGVIVEMHAGSCNDAERLAKQWTLATPENYYAYRMLARTMEASGKPKSLVLDTFEKGWSRIRPELRGRLELSDRIRISMLSGNFEQAEKEAHELDKVIRGDSSASTHQEVASYLIQLYLETNKIERARELADAFLKRSEVWHLSQPIDDTAILNDVIPQMLAILSMSESNKPNFKRSIDWRRNEWFRTRREKTSGVFVPYLWLSGYAAAVQSTEDARLALEKMPEFGAIPAFILQHNSWTNIGRTYLLAGKIPEAIESLERATSSCLVLYEPMASTVSFDLLGRALEASKGSVPNAHERSCEAYGRVLSRWGNAKPSSVTASHARERYRALDCKER